MFRDVTAKVIKFDDKPIPDGTVTGLRLRPTKSKARGSWKLCFVSPETGNRREMGLGVYPEISINEARQLANKACRQVALGIDSISARNNDKKAALIEANILTFTDAAEKVFANSKAGWKNRKHQAQLR